MKLTAHELTGERRLEHCGADHALDSWRAGTGVHWIHLESFSPDGLRSWLDVLDLAPFVRTRLLNMGQVTQVVSVPSAVIVDFRILAKSAQRTRQQVAALCLENLLVTLDPRPMDEAGDRGDALCTMELVERSPGGLLCSLLLYHVDRTAREHQDIQARLFELDTRMDREQEGVTLDEILTQKERMLLLLSVAEEQLECLEALQGTTSEVWDRSGLEGAVGLLISVAGSTDRRTARLEKRVVDLRQRYDTHQADKINRRLGVLTVLSAVFLPLTLFAGIWGMNFEVMPELKIPAAYPIALCLMGLTGGGMILLFHFRGWLK